MRFINFLIKPASSLCNLRCRYCFYADEASNRAMASMGVMTAETVTLLLREAYAAAEPGCQISFAFQGGEPTVAGLDFFRRFTSEARRLKPSRVRIIFSIQTNGTLLNEEWATFFREEDFLVGISVDGFKELHNAHRVDAEGRASWNSVIRNVEMLKKHHVRINALCVVTAQCARSPQKVYQTLKKLGFDYLQFIACLDPIGKKRGDMPWSLSPETYGKFLCHLFDFWFRDWEAGDYHSIRLFDDYIHVLLGDGASTCATCGRCGGYFVVEADGTLYPCDFYALDEWRMGRLGERNLESFLHGEIMEQFLTSSREKPPECAECPWRVICDGGCKNDWIYEGKTPHNYYCKSFRMLFEHGFERMRRIAGDELAARRR